MTDREITRFLTRERIFVRRGLQPAAAEALADRLARRDQEHDDRRCCLECAHMRAIDRCAKREAVLPDVLQRCTPFDWQTQ